jgi:hypothetical protein
LSAASLLWIDCVGGVSAVCQLPPPLRPHMLPRVPPRSRHFHGPLAAAIMSCFALPARTATTETAHTSLRSSDGAPVGAPGDAPTAPLDADPGGSVPNSATSSNDDLGYRERFWLVDPRSRPHEPQPNLMKFQIGGEYQIRFARISNLPLSDYGLSDYGKKLGQTQRLEHRMRFTPRFFYREKLGIVAQFDVPHGTLAGESTNHVSSDPESISAPQPMRFSFRWLYADFRFDGGHVRIGQQPARWGAGLVLDSGDERQALGDPRFGTIVERVAYQGRPFGIRSKFELLLATDWVYSDARVSWLDGDRALRSMIGLSLVDSPQQRIGLLVIGEKFQPRFADAALGAKHPTETTSTFDLAGETAFQIPSQSAYVVASSEAALVLGATDIAPEVFAQSNARVQRFGALVRVGAVGTHGVGERRWGKWGVLLEWGYASGDSDPSDGVDRRFVANPARRVGLVLFDEVLRWKSARAATALADPRIGMRPVASATAMPTLGGVSGATYFSLQWLYRPVPNFDLRTAALIAQASGDLVDPTRLVATGRWSNFDGGSPTHRDLGLELDAGTEYRQPLANGLSVAIGAEGGVLFAGRALAGADGNGIGQQALVRGRFGFYF